jgi:hypothetical protein
MQETLGLLGDRFNDRRGVMADIQTSDTSGEIEQSISINIFDDRAFPASDENRNGAARRARDIAVAKVQEPFRFWPRQMCDKID